MEPFSHHFHNKHVYGPEDKPNSLHILLKVHVISQLLAMWSQSSGIAAFVGFWAAFKSKKEKKKRTQASFWTCKFRSTGILKMTWNFPWTTHHSDLLSFVVNSVDHSIDHSLFPQDSKATYHFFVFLFLLFIFQHLFACAWCRVFEVITWVQNFLDVTENHVIRYILHRMKLYIHI